MNSFYLKSSSNSWFHMVRNTCLQYNLPHLLSILSSPLSKDSWKKLYKKHIINYWEIVLRDEASKLTSLEFFKPKFMSLMTPHPVFATAGSSPYEVCKAHAQALFLSGRYRTELLCKHWSENSGGFCRMPSCKGQNLVEDVLFSTIVAHLCQSAETS